MQRQKRSMAKEEEHNAEKVIGDVDKAREWLASGGDAGPDRTRFPV